MMARRYWTKKELIELFEIFANEFESEAYREKDEYKRGKADAYRLAAFELEQNMK